LYSAVSLKLPTRYRPTCDATVGNNMFYGHYETNETNIVKPNISNLKTTFINGHDQTTHTAN